MNGIREWTIDADRPYHKVKSLCWQGDGLVDWAGGGSIYHLDGTISGESVNYAYRFDSAVVSPSGKHAVIYEKLGTKGLVLRNGKILREINRSFYHANDYEYPIAFLRLPDGRELIAHCPERYNRIEIDDATTGKRLTESPTRKPIDFFYSRLVSNPSATLLLNAGWIWAPWDSMTVYDIEAVLENPSLLDGVGIGPKTSAEISSAAFWGDDKLVMTSSEEELIEDEDEHEDEEIRLLPKSLAVYDLLQNRYISSVVVEDTMGTVMPISDSLVVGFYDHPKIIDLNTGKTLHRWPELKSGNQRSSILVNTVPIPPLALDPTNRRFAVASETAIHVVEIDPASIPRDAG